MSKHSVRALIHDEKWLPWTNLFGIRGAVKKETGGGGRCQFSSVAESLYPIEDYDHKHVRTLVGQQVMKMSKADFDLFLLSYRLEKKSGEFRGQWDPDAISERHQFASLVMRPNLTGNEMSFWGDDHTLSLIALSLKIRIYVFEHVLQNKRVTPRLLVCDIPQTPQYAIMLWYDRAGGHYQCIGIQYEKGKNTIFHLHEIPKEVLAWKNP